MPILCYCAYRALQIRSVQHFQHEALLLTEIAKNTGMDYLIIKPYSQHLMSKTEKYKDIKYSKYSHLSKELSEFNSEEFNVIFRMNTMNKWDERGRKYENCLALPFWSYITESAWNLRRFSLFCIAFMYTSGNGSEVRQLKSKSETHRISEKDSILPDWHRIFINQ